MKKSVLNFAIKYLLVILLGLNSISVFSQVFIDTLAIQDFEVSPMSPVWSYTGSPTILSGYTTSSATPANSPIGINGSRAWETHSASAGVILEFNNKTIPQIYDSIYINFKLAAMNLNGTSGGPDNLDYVLVSYSLDNGNTYTNKLRIKGATSNNSSWAYSATGLAETYYTPTNVVTFQPTTSGLQTTLGYSSCSISFPGTITQLKLKITARSSSSSDTWLIDNVVLGGRKLCYNSFDTITVSACDSYLSPSGNHTWTSSNTYLDTIPNASGCDSIISINLTVNSSSSAIINPTECFSCVSPSGNYTWDTSGTYIDTIQNAMGCDSIITINLTINTVDTSVTKTGIILTASVSGANYQWLDCNNGYAIIPGETNQSYTPAANGTYAVEITENTCVDTSACYLVTGVGIIENIFGLSLNFYPNPTSGKVTVDLGKTYKVINVTVRNTLGQVVLTKTYKTTNQLSFEIDGAKGLYFVEIRTDEGKSSVFKIVKE